MECKNCEKKVDVLLRDIPIGSEANGICFECHQKILAIWQEKVKENSLPGGYTICNVCDGFGCVYGEGDKITCYQKINCTVS